MSTTPEYYATQSITGDFTLREIADGMYVLAVALQTICDTPNACGVTLYEYNPRYGTSLQRIAEFIMGYDLNLYRDGSDIPRTYHPVERVSTTQTDLEIYTGVPDNTKTVEFRNNECGLLEYLRELWNAPGVGITTSIVVTPEVPQP